LEVGEHLVGKFLPFLNNHLDEYYFVHLLFRRPTFLLLVGRYLRIELGMRDVCRPF
jgi:hypothetical protein